MPKIVVIGSCRFEPYEFLAVPEKVPNLYNTEEGYQIACKKFYPAIDKADEVWVYVPDGLGEHTSRDLVYALSKNKTIRMIGEDTTWEQTVKFNDKHFPNWRNIEPVYFSNALAGEVGEICNKIKHFIGGGTHKVEVTKEDVGKEDSDTLIYLVLLLESLGITEKQFLEMFKEKMEENEFRMKLNGANQK